MWSWQHRDAMMSRLAPQRQHGLSVSPYETDSSLGSQSSSRPNEFDFSHPRVDDFVARFQTSLRGFFTRALSRSGRYVPRMSSILQKEGLPQELAYLPLIESGFSVHAVSRAGAVGPWQLIPGTGRRYGLRIDRYVDERRDPVKSTQAAARYLKDLYNMFGDWHLSLAAYNTGEGNIARILEKGRADDFWEMSDRGYLYRETRDFVPGFLAALQIAETPEAYGFDTPEEEPMRYDLVKIDRSLPLSTVAQLSGASTDTIKELNPALRQGVVPPQGYAVRLPKGTKEAFQIAYANYESIGRNQKTTGASTNGAKRKHRVRRGETVASIAEQFNVPVQDLLRANHIRDPRSLQAGRTLDVPQVAGQDLAQVVVAGNRGRSQLLD
jgi:membrane-bound lytic murein transglycosylase D